MFGRCFETPEPPPLCDWACVSRTCFIVSGILICSYNECFPESTPVAADSKAEKCKKNKVQQSNPMLNKNLSLTILFLVLRAILCIPGFYCMFFYYSSLAIVGLKLLFNYESICCSTSRNVFFMMILLTLASGFIGFVEKTNSFFMPTLLLIDFLALGLAVSYKPWVMEKLFDYVGYKYEGFYTPKWQKLVSWMSDAFVIFVAARNVGMMVFCMGLISQPCRFSEMTFT
jgi:hypothetical protein